MNCWAEWKSKTNLLWHTHFYWYIGANKFNQCDKVSSQAKNLKRHLKTYSGKSHISVTYVILYSRSQAIWGHIWKSIQKLCLYCYVFKNKTKLQMYVVNFLLNWCPKLITRLCKKDKGKGGIGIKTFGTGGFSKHPLRPTIFGPI